MYYQVQQSACMHTVGRTDIGYYGLQAWH